MQYHLYTVAMVSSVCLSLPPPTNGVISYSDSPLGENTVATYTCNPGYTLTGGTTRTCGSGVWSGSAPTCQRKWNKLWWYCLFVECIVSHTANCPDLPSLTNGMITYSAGSTNNRPFLTRAGSTNNRPFLTRAVTLATLSVEGAPPGPVLIEGDGVGHLQSVNVSSTVIIVGWYNYVNTVPTEPPTTCSDLTVPANVMISYNLGTASLRPVNTVATYTCDTGYTVNGGTSTRTCGSDRLWRGLAPTCQSEWNGLYSSSNSYVIPNILVDSFLWPSSLYYQRISWTTNQYNEWRRGDLHLWHWIPFDWLWNHHMFEYWQLEQLTVLPE